MDILLGYTECELQEASVHHVGNKENEGELRLSEKKLDITNEELRHLLLNFFLTPFQGIEFYHFLPGDEETANPVYDRMVNLFDNHSDLHDDSVKIAQHLFDVSTHPNIKSGDLFVAKFKNIHVGDQVTEAIGIFKAENKIPFLQVDHQSFHLNYEEGFNVEKLDKGCLVLNIDRENGYRVCIVDKANRAVDAQYWRDHFLQLSPCADNFNSTKEFLNLTKKFITKQVPEEFEVSKTDKIDLLNRSLDYFKTNEAFYKEDFETEVLQDENLIESFRNYDRNYRNEQGIEFDDHFAISDQAVKKQSRSFKSIIKLDKNFHIYVHGNKNLIEQGIDESGRKYYKIYFENEM